MSVYNVKESNMRERVALGLVPGWTSFRKFGMNPAVVSSTTQEMWPPGTAKVWPTSAGTLSCVSDSAEDDENEATPPGTGVWSIRVEGLDGNFDEISEDIVMTGTTPATGTLSFFRVNRAYVIECGSGGINAGNISISVGGNLQAYIEANQGQTHQTHYTVPRNKVLLVTKYAIGVGRMSGSTDLNILAQIRLRDETKNGNYQGWRSISDIWLWNGGNHANHSSATVLPSKTDVRQVIDSDTTTQAHGIFGGFLIDADKFDT